MHFISCNISRLIKKIFILLTAVIFVFGVFMFTGCSKDNENTNDSETTASPTVSATATPKPALIKNGNFEETYDTSYPKTPKYWSSYGDSFGGKTATLSNSKYGIISVEEESFNENKADKYGDIDNPGTPDGSEDDNIIMINNNEPSAVKYKSQSISLPINSYAEISLYVKTIGIEPLDNDNPDNYTNYGASVTLSGMEEAVYINGIIEDDWTLYKIYLEGSSVSAKTLYLELGLGTGSDANSRGYTKGHAFFDSVTMDFINKAEYENIIFGNGTTPSLVEIDGGNPVYTSDSDKFFYYDNDKYDINPYFANRIDVKDTDDTLFAYSYLNRVNIDTEYVEDITFNEISVDHSSYIQDITTYVDYNGQKIDVDGNYGDLTDYPYLSEELENYPFSSTKVFTMNNDIYGTQGCKTNDFTILSHSPAVNDIYQSYSYYRIGVYVKTSDFLNNGLNIYLIKEDLNGMLTSSFTDVNTGVNNLSEEDLEEDANIHNKWANWTEYVFYVEASPYEDVNVRLEFWLGPQDVSRKQEFDFTKGYALFSDLSIQKLSSSEYSSATSGDKVKTGIKLENYDNISTSSPQIANSGFNISNETGIINKPINPSSWKGYFGGYKLVTGDDDSVLVANHSQNSVVSGIINENYLGNYNTNNYIDNTLIGNIVSGVAVGEPNYLMIYNKEATSYGYITPVKTLSIESCYVFSVKAKAYGNARAAIYLTDEDGKIIEITDDSKYTKYEDLSNGWTKYSFYIKTGELTKNAKVELWNGTRDGLTTSTGYVLFDDVYMGSIEEEVYNDVVEDVGIITKLDFEGVDIAPEETETPTIAPTETPEETEAPVNNQPFNWGMTTMLLIAVVLLFVVGVIIVRRTKQSKLFKPRKVKVQKPSYSRDKLKIKAKEKINEKQNDANNDDEIEEDEDYNDED